MRRQFARFLLVVAVAAPILTAITVARAQDARIHTVYIVDYQTGTVLLDKDSMARSEPASLTKMMTAYLAFEALKEGKIKLTDTLPASEGASRMRGSRMFIERGSNVRLRTCCAASSSNRAMMPAWLWPRGWRAARKASLSA